MHYQFHHNGCELSKKVEKGVKVDPNAFLLIAATLLEQKVEAVSFIRVG